jgi:hypothetical protein
MGSKQPFLRLLALDGFTTIPKYTVDSGLLAECGQHLSCGVDLPPRRRRGLTTPTLARTRCGAWHWRAVPAAPITPE